MDILPACMPNSFEKEAIKIPEKALKEWSSGNPKGFSIWFLNTANTVQESLLKRNFEALMKAQIETEQLPEEIYFKTPLQRATQLLKRYRDIYFQRKNYRVSSIVITTLLGQLYQAENSIFETIDNVVKRIKDNYTTTINQGYRFKVLNPVNSEEDFTDSWTSEHYNAFYNFINNKDLNAYQLEDLVEICAYFGAEGVKYNTKDKCIAFLKEAFKNALKFSVAIIVRHTPHGCIQRLSAEPLDCI
jgi:hypothetical protein